uniref:Uncharacterized protein n=1 Tax=Vespula pensylvanica TaxID=30213 RepID=A0A834U7S8_VESPE|nr:hypothetical protein H0235_010528 [Vespula pensylvanica]
MTKPGNGAGEVRLLFLSRIVDVTSCSIIVGRKHSEEKIPTDRFLKRAMWFETNRFLKRNRYLFGSTANEHTLPLKAVKLLRLTVLMFIFVSIRALIAASLLRAIFKASALRLLVKQG